MKQFALACLMAASIDAVAVEQYDEDFVHPWATACEGEDCNIWGGDYDMDSFPTLEEALNAGNLVPVHGLEGLTLELDTACYGDDCDAEEVCGEDCAEDCGEDCDAACSGSDCSASCSGEDCDAVIDQITYGFEQIEGANLAIEQEDVYAAQEDQSAEIEAIIAATNVAVEEQIVDAVKNQESLGFEDLEAIYDNRTEEIADTNAEHDTQIAAISKDHAVAEVINNDVRDEIIDDIINAA